VRGIDITASGTDLAWCYKHYLGYSFLHHSTLAFTRPSVNPHHTTVMLAIGAHQGVRAS
jgi:hypothetical protein